MMKQQGQPMWGCWCIPIEGGLIPHKYTEIACPVCGRLQPPKNVMKIIMGRYVFVDIKGTPLPPGCATLDK